MAYDDSFTLLAFFAGAGVLGWAIGYALGALFEAMFRR